jgi:hypothetical protein
MKMALGGSLNAEHAWTPFNDVEVQFENSLLGQSGFQHPGDDEFFQFANRIPGIESCIIPSRLVWWGFTVRGEYHLKE